PPLRTIPRLNGMLQEYCLYSISAFLIIGASSGGSSSTSNSNIQGDFSGNSGSGNVYISVNREDMSPSRNYAKILQCLYTSKYQSHRARVREPVHGTCTWVTGHPKY